MGVIVETTAGRVEGVREPAHLRFRGIPYAEPPVGSRRFRAPEPVASWDGVRDASRFGLSAPQPPPVLAGMEPGPQGEDCLYLNVYTPDLAGARPVMVWIHGGGFTGGSGAQDLYDGGRLAARGDVVVVTLNYRLGALGYLCLDGADTNLGQRDQVLALEWVRDNIERFGGDPSNVTIFGESAGGMAVTTLLAMPAARGLFRRAIPQSGAAHHTHTRETAGRVAGFLLDALGGGFEALRAAPVDELLKAQAKSLAEAQKDPVGLAYAPVVDGESLPHHPIDAIRRGDAAGVDLLIGSNRDESKLFTLALPRAGFDAETLERRLRRLLRRHEGRAPGLIEAYRAARAERDAPTDPFELWDALQSDRSFRVPAIRAAEAQAAHNRSTFMYLFNWESPARRGALGAAHAVELPFVFGTLDAPTMDRFAGKGPDAEALASRMMDAWIAFARTGDPAHADLPAWPGYDAERRSTMLFDRRCALDLDPLGAERAAWDGIL